MMIGDLVKIGFIDIVFEYTETSYLVFIIVFFISLFGIYLYREIAVRIGIIANPNFRTLHEYPIPKGGGIVFALVFMISVVVFWWYDKLSDHMFFILAIGGCVAALFGFLDDIMNIRASRKLIVQFCLSGWVLFWLDGGPLLQIDWVPCLVGIPLSALFLVWVINAYNFMDGIDGMAASGAVFVTGTLILVILLTNGASELGILFLLLMASTGAFIVFNWPPASIFMGDAGSVFLGYVFGSFILVTVMSGEISAWTWLVVFGYFFADTTVTQIARVILVKKWYGAHRSHAYQNLARITGSHLNVVMGVTAYHLVWILPLTLWTVLQPEMAIAAAGLAVVPGLVVTYMYGPVLSSS